MEQVYVCLHKRGSLIYTVYTLRLDSTSIVEIGPPRHFSNVSGAKIAKPVNLEFRRRDRSSTVANFYDSAMQLLAGSLRDARVDSKNTSYLIYLPIAPM